MIALPGGETLFGLSKVLASIEREWSDSKLVVLVGPPGIGKTATARACIARASPATGVRFCDLSDIVDRPGLYKAVADQLGLALKGADPEEQIGHALRGQDPILLVLDGVDGVATAVSDVVLRWQAMAPAARILLTTRQALSIGRKIEVGPLPKAAAQQLFFHRATAAGYRVKPSDLRNVDKLVGLLGGIPLAIELVAAQAVRENLKVILHDLAARKASLGPFAAAVHSSWEQLSSAERAAFSQCSVFRGTFDEEAATAVVDLADVHAKPTPHLLKSLRDRSLLAGDGPYRIYESLRSYAGDRLAESPRRARETALRHADWFLRRAPEIGDGIHGPRGAWHISELGRLAPNLLAVHYRYLDRDLRRSIRAVLALRPLYQARGPYDEYLDLVDRCLDRADGVAEVADLLPELRGNRGFVLVELGRMGEARAELEIVLYDCDEDVVLGRAQADLGLVAAIEGRIEESAMRYASAQTLFRKVEDWWALGGIYHARSMVDARMGNFDAAEKRANQALALYRERDLPRGEAMAREALAHVAMNRAKWEEAAAHYRGAMEMAAQTGRTASEVRSRLGLADATRRLGDLKQAETHARQSIAAARQLGAPRVELWAGLVLASIQRGQGALDLAMEAYRRGRVLAGEIRFRDMQREAACRMGEICLQRGQLTEAMRHLNTALRDSQTDDPESARILGAMAAVRALQGDVAEAIGHLDAATRLDGIDVEARQMLVLYAGFVELARYRETGDASLLGDVRARAAAVEAPRGSDLEQLTRLLASKC